MKNVALIAFVILLLACEKEDPKPECQDTVGGLIIINGVGKEIEVKTVDETLDTIPAGGRDTFQQIIGLKEYYAEFEGGGVTRSKIVEIIGCDTITISLKR